MRGLCCLNSIASPLLRRCFLLYAFMQDTRILTKSDSGVIAEMSIGDVPVCTEVLAATPIKGVRWEKVVSVTKKEDCPLKKVTTTRGFSFVCPDAASLIAFNPNGGLRRIKPDETVIYEKDSNGKDVVAFAHAVPVARHAPVLNPLRDHGFEIGWLIGAFVSNGSISAKNLIFIKINDAVREQFMKYIGIVSGTPGFEKLARHYRSSHNAATNGGIGGRSMKAYVPTSKLPKMIADLFFSCYDTKPRNDFAEKKKRSCLTKRLPPDFTTYGNDVLMGIISGLLDGDGSMSIHKEKTIKGNDTWVGKPQVMCAVSTSSAGLRYDIILLGKLVGMSLNYSTIKANDAVRRKNDNYVIPLSIEWLWDNLRKIKTVTRGDVLDYLRKNKPACAIINVTPISYYALTKLEQAYPEVKNIPSASAWSRVKCRAKKYGYNLFKRETSRLYAQLIMHYVDEYNRDKALYSVVRAAFDDDITWTRYKSVEDIPAGTVYSLDVPKAKVLSLTSGLIIPSALPRTGTEGDVGYVK